MEEQQNNRDEIDLKNLIDTAIKNKFLLISFGLIFSLIGFLILSSTDKIYRSEIKVEALKDFSYFMSGDTQKDFKAIGFTPLSIADRMVLNATSLELIDEVRSKYGNPDVSLKSVQDQYGQFESLGIYWTLSASGNFSSKSNAKKFLTDLVNLSYDTTINKISERLNNNYLQMSEFIENKLIIHSELIDQKKERIKTYLDAAQREVEAINNQKKVLIKNELKKAEILNIDNPSSNMIPQNNNSGSVYIEESNYIIQQVENDEEENTQDINDERKDMNALKDFSPKIETLFFLGKKILEEELRFIEEEGPQKSNEIIALETELAGLDDQKKPAFIKDLNKYIDKENQYMFYSQVFDSAFDKNNKAVNFRTHLIKARPVNVLPLRFSLPIIFLFGIISGYLYVIIRDSYRKG